MATRLKVTDILCSENEHQTQTQSPFSSPTSSSDNNRGIKRKINELEESNKRLRTEIQRLHAQLQSQRGGKWNFSAPTTIYHAAYGCSVLQMQALTGSNNNKFLTLEYSPRSNMKLWDFDTGKCGLQLDNFSLGHAHPIRSFACDSKFLVTGDLDGAIHVWGLDEGRCQGKLGLTGKADSVLSLALTHQTSSSMAPTPYTHLFDNFGSTTNRSDHVTDSNSASSQQLNSPFSSATPRSGVGSTPSTSNTTAQSPSTTGMARNDNTEDSVGSIGGSLVRTCVNGTESGFIRIWDLSSLENVREIQGHKASVYDVKFMSDNRTFATCSRDKHVSLWDVRSPSACATFADHRRGVYSVRVDSSTNTLMSGSYDETVRVYDLRMATSSSSPGQRDSASCRKTIEVGSSVFCLQFDAEHLLVGTKKGDVCVYDISGDEFDLVTTIPAQQGDIVYCLYFDNTRLVTGGDDGDRKSVV